MIRRVLKSAAVFQNAFLNSPGTEIKLQDVKTEPPSMFFGSPFGSMSNDSKQGMVSVAITLRPSAAEVRILTFTEVGQKCIYNYNEFFYIYNI